MNRTLSKSRIRVLTDEAHRFMKTSASRGLCKARLEKLLKDLLK